MSRQFWANLALCVLLGSLAIFVVSRMGSALTIKGLFVSDPKPSKEAAPLMPDVMLTGYAVGKSPDNLIEANFSIRNNSSQDIKNIGVHCEFFDSRGEYMDRKWWSLPEKVPAGQEVKISSTAEQFVNTRARALNCRIADFQLVKEPLFSLNRAAAVDHGSPAGNGHNPDAVTGGH